MLTDQVRTLYRQTHTVLFANCANAAIVVVLLWSAASGPLLLAWLGAVLVVAGARFMLWRRFRAAEPELGNSRTWGARFVVGSAASGTLWGLAGFWFLAGASPLSQLLLAFFVGGMCSAAAGTLAVHLPAFVAYTLPALSGLALRVALYGDSLHLVLAGVLVLYGAGLFAVAKVNARALSEAFALRHENADLLATLSMTQRRLEDANRTLEQRVAERTEALHKQSQALREAQRLEAVGRLAGGVAHDFNNLLTVILANLSELSAYGAIDARTRSALHEMRQAASKGADLVSQLLTFSRRRRGAPEKLDLNRVLIGMDRLLSRLLGERLRLRLELPEAALFVHADPTQIEQVVINLITNARDAMQEGGEVVISSEAVELDSGTERLAPGAYAVLSVTDTGTGMDAETQRRMFEPFFTTKEVGKGTGLGLSTTHGIIEQAGGDIEVSSSVGKGSTFRVYLPLASAPSREARREASARNVSGLRPITRAARTASILLVEDEPTVRSIARRILTRAGHRVLTASSAEAALELAAEQPEAFELLITDVVMGGMNGLELAERLRAERPGLHTLFISGYSHEHRLPGDGLEARCFLAKPFTHDALLARVAELLGPATEPRLAAEQE